MAMRRRLKHPNLASERGVALITALLISMVALAMVLMTIYLVTQGTQVSGLYKRYQTALEASYGGSDFMVKEIIPKVFLYNGTLSTAIANGGYGALIQGGYVGDSCFNDKLTKTTTNWGATCSSTLDPTDNADITLTLGGQAQATYNVYIKIVDTKPGNSDLSGLDLQSGGTTESILGAPPQHFPLLYRIEVLARKQNAPEERAQLSILYEY